VETYNNELPRDWENKLITAGVHYIGFFFHTFFYYWAEESIWFVIPGSLFHGVHYMGVSLSVVFMHDMDEPQTNNV